MAAIFIPKWILTWLTVKQGNETYHFNYSYRDQTVAEPSPADLLTIATDIYNRVAPALAGILTTNCTIQSCTARSMSMAGAPEQSYIPTSPTVGTAAGDAEPANVAATMSYNPTAVGKGVKGRTFISGFPDTLVVSQVLASTLVATLATIAASLRTYSGPAGAVLYACIASRKHVLLRDIVSSTVSAQVNNQIRRLIGHRRHKRHVVTP